MSIFNGIMSGPFKYFLDTLGSEIAIQLFSEIDSSRFRFATQVDLILKSNSYAM